MTRALATSPSASATVDRGATTDPPPFASMPAVPGEPRLADVARTAGVSIATASRALTGRGPVAEPTRARVLSAARRLEFEPSAAGRSLRTRTTGLIGFVVPDVGSAFYANALKGAQHRLALAGYQVALMDTDERPEREEAALRALGRQGVDGIIVCSTGGSAAAIRDLRRRRGVPIIFFDNLLPGLGDGAVALANEQGVRILVDHLALIHGRTRIGYVGGLRSETSGAERLAGFQFAVAARGLDADPELLRDGDWTTKSGARETARLLALERPPEAVVYADALMALGGLSELRARGRHVPSDVAIVSFDDSDSGPLLDPPITALVRRDRAIGDLAASLLVRVLDGGPPDPVEVRLPMEPVIRRSCGCAQEDAA